MFRRLEDWVIRRLPSRRSSRDATIQVLAEGIQIRAPSGSRLVRWREVDRVVAARAEQFIGDTFVLVFGLRDGSALKLTEGDPAWPAAVEILPIALPGATDRATWGVALLASANGEVEVFRRRPAIQVAGRK